LLQFDYEIWEIIIYFTTCFSFWRLFYSLPTFCTKYLEVGPLAETYFFLLFRLHKYNKLIKICSAKVTNGLKILAESLIIRKIQYIVINYINIFVFDDEIEMKNRSTIQTLTLYKQIRTIYTWNWTWNW
jgi:hypothetical protein